MQELPNPQMKNYFVYLPECPAAAVWGCSATSAGYARIAPGTAYPPVQHPDDHHFTWARGRILQSYAFVLISQGGGIFESDQTPGKLRLEAGSIFLLFPGVWHRYAPDAATGWVEHWLVCRGPAFDRARAEQLIDPKSPVHAGGPTGDIAEVFARIHGWAAEEALANQDLLSTLGIHLLALLGRSSTSLRADGAALLIQQAKMRILECYDERLNMEELARELKVGYSHFRQLFKVQTGMSPKHYHLDVRLARARDFLANTDKPVKEIAGLLGFHSAFHFSHQFKAATGAAPSEWRLQQGRRE